MRDAIYGVVVAGYVLAGGLDLQAGDWKPGVTAMLFAAANWVIFFWRT